MSKRRATIYAHVNGRRVRATNRRGDPIPSVTDKTTRYSVRYAGRFSRTVIGYPAVEALAQQLEAAGISDYAAANKKPMDALVATYIESRERKGCAHNTIRSYQAILGDFARWYFHRRLKRPAEITRDNLIEFAGWNRNHGLGPATVKHAVQVVQRFLRHAVGINVPLKDDDLPRIKAKLPDAYTLAEMEALLANSTGDDRLAWELLASTGMRGGELTALTYDDLELDPAAPVIRIRPKLLPDGTRWQPKTPKSIRDIPLHPVFADDLRARNGQPNEYVIPSPTGGREVNLLRRLHACADKAGVRNATLHKFRRTFASNVVNGANPPNIAAAMMGHSSVTPTLRFYTAQAEARSNAQQQIARSASEHIVRLRNAEQTEQKESRK